MAETTSTPTTAAVAATDPQKMKWEAPDGIVYEDSPEKIAKIAIDRYTNLYPEYSKIKTEAEQAREQLNIVQQATTGRSAEPAADQFNSQKYWGMMQNNPLEAQRYANKFDPDYQQARADIRTTLQNQQAALFKAEHSDFDANEANVEKLARTCQELFPGSDVYSSRQMSAAHALVFNAKPQTTTAPNVPAIPPAASASTATGAPNIGAMNQDQLKAYILQLEQQGRTQ